MLKPRLILDSGNEIELFDQKLDIKLGKKSCTGSVINGVHRSCSVVTEEWKCTSCMEKDDYFSCISCRGECMNPKQRMSCMKNIYNIYLACFGEHVKVGISIGFRLRERLIEQGADFAAKIMTMKDGKVVRKHENMIRSIAGIEDRIHGNDKMKNIVIDPNTTLKKLTSVLDSVSKKIEIHEPEIYDFRSFYRLNELMQNPAAIDPTSGMHISGNVIGAKGNIIVLNNGGYKAVNAHRLIGYHLE